MPSVELAAFARALAEGFAAFKKLLDSLRRDGFGIQVSLGQFAAHIPEQVRLRLCFDTLRNHLQAETVGERDNETNDFAGFDVRVHARDERTVDLQRIHWKALQPAEGGVASAEVVDVQMNPELRQQGSSPVSFKVCRI